MNSQKYEGMSDEDIVLLSKKGDNDAATYILDKYKGMVRGKARGLYLVGGESEDLIQEGMIGLFEAIQSYNPEKDASFYSFAALCVSRQMYTAVKAAGRKKHSPLNTYVSLDQDTKDQDGQDMLASYALNGVSAEDLFIDREYTALMKHKLMEELSPLEQNVLKLYLKGVNYTEIAGLLDMSSKSVDNALQRIKNKSKKIFQ